MSERSDREIRLGTWVPAEKENSHLLSSGVFFTDPELEEEDCLPPLNDSSLARLQGKLTEVDIYRAQTRHRASLTGSR